MSVSAISPLLFVPCPFRELYLIFYRGRCAYLGCLIGLNLKKTDPEQAIEWKKCIKSSKKLHPAHTKHNSAYFLFIFFSVKLPFEQAYNPPQNAWGHISTPDSTHLFVVRLLFQKVAKICNFRKVANFCDRVNAPFSLSLIKLSLFIYSFIHSFSLCLLHGF